MTPERWQQIKEVFDSAIALEPEQRPAFLAESCDEDHELRAEVESLLESEELNLTLLDGKVLEVSGRMLAQETDVAGKRLGNYRILREVGRGGMAAVYAAVRADEQYRQQVAIKLIRHGMDSERMVARFRQERQILANLVHPNIARLLDGGLTDDGLPYLVMELIEGEPIDAYCDRHQLSIQQRLELFRTVCAAVHYAHQNLVVHRDLKPSNILVTTEGAPKLLDFGIAKLIEPATGEVEIGLTLDGPRPMTPEYASPEQVLDQPVTTASDVYALGVLLYSLLTGKRPYRIEQLNRREIERVICDQEPARPSSTFVRSIDVPGDDEDGPTHVEVSRDRASTPEQLHRLLRGDLDNIVMMAMRKTPERRYGSAQQLSGDIRRHLERRPIIARDDTFGYRATKFVRRNRIVVAAGLLVFLSLAGGLAAALWQADVARTERQTAESVSDFVVHDIFEVSDPEKALGENITARQLLDQAAEKIDRLDSRPKTQAALMDALGSVYLGLGLLDEAEPLLEEALALRRQHLRSKDPALADSIASFAELMVNRGTFPEAERLYREALTLRRQQLDADDPRLAENENALAAVLMFRGQHDEAEAMLRRALERQQRFLGAEHEGVADTLNSLGIVLGRKGRIEEEKVFLERALAMGTRLLDESHPQIIVTLNNLASAQCRLGEHQKARSLFERAESLGQKVFGTEHPSLATTRHNLASCLLRIDDVETAEKLMDSALELRLAALGPNHPDVAASLNNLGRLYYDQGQYSAAEKLFRQALTIYRLQRGDLHPNAAQPLNNLAAALARLGQLEEAEDLYREALGMNRTMFGAAHEEIALNLNNLADVLERRGNLTAAADHFRLAIAMYQDLFGGKHLQAGRARHSLALVLRVAGRLGEAEAEARAAVALRRELLGDAARELGLSATLLGRLLVEQKRPQEAETVLRETIAMWRRLPLGQQQPGLAITGSVLGKCLIQLESFSEAEALLAESHAYLSSRFGPDHRYSQETGRWLEELLQQPIPEQEPTS